MATEVSQWIPEHVALASSGVGEGRKQMSSKKCEEGDGEEGVGQVPARRA